MPRREPASPTRPSFRLSARARRRSGLPASPTSGLIASPTPSPRGTVAASPWDQASYSCSCGFVFRAAVDTSVSCPHCQRAQAW